MHKWMSCFAVMVAVLSLCGASWLSYQYVVHKNEINATAKNDLMEITSVAASQIDVLLMEVVRSAEVLASEMSKGRLPEKEMYAMLRDLLKSNVHYFGGTITFRPYGYDESRKLYSAYYTRDEKNELIFQHLDEVYDYTSSEYDWYVVPMEEGSRWGEPYWDKAARTNMVTYSAVFYQPGSTAPLGVVTIDISMNQVQTIIESLDLGPSGFGALTTREGGYLYHPNQAYVQNKKNIRDVAKEKGDANRLIIAKDILLGKGGVIDHVSTTTGQASWLIYESVPVSGWSLQNTFIKDDLPIDVDLLRKDQIRIILLAVIFLIAAAFLLFRVHHGERSRVWLFTAICSLILMVGIGAIWHLALTYYSSSNVPGVKISDKETLKAVVHGYSLRSQERQMDRPYYVPTGIYIDTIEFQSANNLLIAGRVWQAYASDYPAEMKKGFSIGRAKNLKTTELNRSTLNGKERIQWRFQAALRVNLDYSRYPLEVEHLNLQLLPAESDRMVVLVPDLDAYKLMASSLLPGLDKAIFLAGWDFSGTFFELREERHNTDFGIKRNLDHEILPTLYYHIGIQRVFVDAFISNLTPLIIVAIILFALALLPREVEIGRVLSICAAVFFIVVFSHLDIRKSIPSGEIFYLEYFFFVIYFCILMVPLNAFRLAMGLPSRLFEYKDGLIVQAAYWPSVLGIFFMVTACKFY
ncbi:hypothetical protein MNBD_GAMMA17-1274 [hydrothermal vent metagenome]|uniref:Uncharacterized protein n=1 Tax=hydrothermal vent metagenome TaxID=652676 RepID=A0A3B0ZE19_9ZZZZ